MTPKTKNDPMQDPETVQSSTCPDQETFDRIMRIARRDPITGPALKFTADAFKDNLVPPTRVTFATGMNGPCI